MVLLSKIKPINMRVLVLPDKTPEAYGRIIIPDAYREKCVQGMILALDKRLKYDKKYKCLKPGDRVLYGTHAGIDVDITDDVTRAKPPYDSYGCLLIFIPDVYLVFGKKGGFKVL